MNVAQIYNEAFNAGLRPDPDLTVTEWADTHRMLPRKSSPEPGKYRSSRTPYMREIMDCLSPMNPTQEICFMKSVQIGATEGGNNWVGYVVDVSPGPMMMVFPTVELAKDHSKQKLAPTIEETERLRGKIKEKRTRDSGNTLQVKEFPGGILFLTGSNSAAGFRAKSLRYLFLDDIDGYEHDVGGEGDPVELAKKRTDTYSARKKVFEVSTPTTKGVSRIEKSFEESDQRYYHVPCPLCETMQQLKWGGEGADFGIKFERDGAGNVTDAWYECKECHGRIDEYHKTKMMDRGVWVPMHPGRKKRGYHLSGLYSPLGWVSWKQIVEEFLEAKNDRERLKVWVNTRLGQTFEEAGDQPDWVSLQERCETYQMFEVPAGGLLLTAGVDVQANRLAVVVRAWGPGEESWLIVWGEIYGDPGQKVVWDQLDELLNRAYVHASGHDLHIASVAVDSGHFTQEVYQFCRMRGPKVFAIKGQSQTGKPVVGQPTMQDINWRGKRLKAGVQLWPVGTDTAKSTIYGRLKLIEPGPGFYHWPTGLADEYFVQLTAEKLVTRYVKGFPKMEWVKIASRNEALDCEVYCYAAAIRAGMAWADWNQLRPGGEKKKAAPRPPSRRQGFIPKMGTKRGQWLGR